MPYSILYLLIVDSFSLHMKFRLIIILLLFLSCESVVYDVPADVEEYIKTFESESQLRGFDYKIDNIRVFFVLDDDMKNAMASIKVTKSGRIRLRINKRYWDAYEIYPMRREAIIMHEFGHYPLMRNHNDIDNSLMNDNKMVIQIVRYAHDREEMLDELFR